MMLGEIVDTPIGIPGGPGRGGGTRISVSESGLAVVEVGLGVVTSSGTKTGDGLLGRMALPDD